ncbi:MAG: hypothetical protein HYS18_13180 [Burkholderiales bacterium]|nr:hypothetical protein [Burkholderiales bacterium]
MRKQQMIFKPKAFFSLLFFFLVFASMPGYAEKNFAREAREHIPAPDARCPQEGERTDEAIAASIHLSVERLNLLKRLRALTNDEVCMLPTAKLKRALEKTEPVPTDFPAQSAIFRGLQQRDERGVIPPNAYLRAVAQRNAVPKTKRMGLAPTSVQERAAGVSSSQWTALGPGNIGGRVNAIVIHPTDTNKIWAAAVLGGIWYSANAGASWSPVNDFLPNLAVKTLVIDPLDPNVMYAGTGDALGVNISPDVQRGAGVYKSTDGGVTWTRLASTDPTVNSSWYYVNRLAIHPTQTNIIVAATESGAMRSTDGGTTWTSVSTARSKDVQFDPNNGAKVIRGRRDGMVSYSTDAGATWQIATVTSNTSARIEIAYAKSTPDLVYASVDVNNGSIYKSVDGGVSWTFVSNPAHLSTQGWYANTIVVSPVDANQIIIGGLDLYSSTNGGASFTKISTWYYSPTSPHADHHALTLDPGFNGASNRKLYNGNDGGIYRANDINAVNASYSNNGWTMLNNGLAITQFYSGAGYTGGNIIGGTQDNGSLKYAGSGTNWTAFFGGDGGFSAIDTSNSNYLYGEYVYLTIHRATNGSSGSYICKGITDAIVAYCENSSSTQSSKANFIAPFILDPNNNNRMLAGGASLWVSDNVKATTPTWRILKSSIGTSTSYYISAIAVASGNSDIIWVGHNNGSVYKTTNGTQTTPNWTLVSNPLPGRFVTRILIDKSNSNLVYATFGGYTSGNVWRTTDGGTSWTNISTGLPQAPIRAIARHPNNANWLYVGSEVGVFTSENGGTSWLTTNDGPANVAVDELFWLDSSTLVAATFGRGMFKATINSSGTSVVPQTGWWWNPNEGGRGYTIEQQGNNIFMAAYMYDSSGRAIWYAAGPAAVSGSTFTAPLLTYVGGQSLTGSWRAPTGTTNNGNISITFSDASHGTISWPNGSSTAIQRYDIVSGGASATPPAGTPQAGWWWNSSEGGRGYSIEIQNGTMFMAGYMYDSLGSPIWYASGPMAMTNTSTYQGTWQQYGNGQTLTGSYQGASVVNGNVGNVTVQFSSTTTGTMTLPDGRQIPIVRYTF